MSRTRRLPRILLPLAAGGLLFATAGCGVGEAPMPDVVLVSLDTVRADYLGAWGSPVGATPHLDRFARRNAQFAACIAQASSTLPSHRSLFQSRVASHTREASPMLAELFAAAGYRTAAFTGGGNVSAEFGFGRGFGIYEEQTDGLAWAADRFFEWSAAEDGPRFAFLHGYDAHVPYDPPAPYARLYADPDYAGPVVPERTRVLCRALRGLEEEPAPVLSPADRRQLVALYNAGLRVADARFGRIVRGLEERGRAASTVLVALSDHGEEFFDHGSVLHSHTVYQELVHVPLIIAVPAAAPGLFPETVRNLDVAPTVLAAAGVAGSPDHQGRPLLERLHGAPAAEQEAVSEMRDLKALVSGPWKLIADPARDLPELYDLERDPGERHDVAAQERTRFATLGQRLFAQVLGVRVRELSEGEVSDEVQERLRALGYVE